jgi:SAM-dependent methyltransferase
VAIDVQRQMVAGLRRRAARAGLEGAIDIRLAEPDRLGIDDLAGQVDLVLAFYVVHELPRQDAFFAEVARALKPDGAVLVVEPPLHVSRAAFESSLAVAERAGLVVRDRPGIGLSRAALLHGSKPRASPDVAPPQPVRKNGNSSAKTGNS